MITVYHYVSEEKYDRIVRGSLLRPSSPFNSRVSEDEWGKYVKRFPFPVSREYICAFFEPNPSGWREYGLLDLLMEEFAGGDYLLELMVEDIVTLPVLIREHKFHSPKAYGVEPQVWRRREVRDSRPDLRNEWYKSAVLLRDYDFSYVCPEVLIPFAVPLAKIKLVEQ